MEPFGNTCDATKTPYLFDTATNTYEYMKDAAPSYTMHSGTPRLELASILSNFRQMRSLPSNNMI